MSTNDQTIARIVVLMAIAVSLVMLVLGISFVQTTWAAEVEDSTPAQCEQVADDLVLLAASGYSSHVYAEGEAKALKDAVTKAIGPAPEGWDDAPILVYAYSDENPQAFLMWVKDGCLLGHATGDRDQMNRIIENAFGTGA